MKRLLIAVLLLCSVHAFGSWAITKDVQSNTSIGVSKTVTIPGNLTNPSTLLITTRWGRTGPASCSTLGGTGCCTDTAGNTFTTKAYNSDTGVGGFAQSMSILTADNTHTTSSDVVTCTGFGDNIWIEAVELTGGSSYVDGSVTPSGLVTSGNGANVMIYPSFTTTQNGDFIFATWAVTPGISGWSAGTIPLAFTLLSGTVVWTAPEYYIQSSAGAIAPTYGYSGGGVNTWGGIAIALAPSAPASNRHQAIVATSR